MNLNTIENKTLALAALFQACQQVRNVALRGKSLNQSIETCLHSLFKTQSTSVDDIYGGISGLLDGLKTLEQQLNQRAGQTRDIEVIRYVFALIYLERKLIKQNRLMDKLAAGIETAKQQAEYFSQTHTNVIASLANLYQQTVSTLHPKIMVQGEPEILSNPDNSDLIRALLLAGMRAAILWRQCGGSRLQLLFSRRKIVQTCEALLVKAQRQTESDFRQ